MGCIFAKSLLFNFVFMETLAFGLLLPGLPKVDLGAANNQIHPKSCQSLTDYRSTVSTGPKKKSCHVKI